MKQTIADFTASLEGHQPPSGCSVYLQALWYDKKGNWQQAHQLVDSLPGRDAAAVHAYLHRVEGDQGNAAYWYRQAGLPFPEYSLEEEWALLTARFI